MTTNTTMIDKVYSNTDSGYRSNEINLIGVANVIGSGAGAAVTTAISFTTPLPTASYNVQVTPGQDAVPYVTSKTTSGFNVVLNPRLAANTLAVGTFDVVIKYTL